MTPETPRLTITEGTCPVFLQETFLALGLRMPEGDVFDRAIQAVSAREDLHKLMFQE